MGVASIDLLESICLDNSTVKYPHLCFHIEAWYAYVYVSVCLATGWFMKLQDLCRYMGVTVRTIF